MIAILTACDRGFTWILRLVILLTSAIVTLALVALVISRYVFNYALIGMHEASLLAAIWLYMAGAIAASRNGEHLVVDMLPSALQSRRAKAIHSLVISALTLGIACLFAFWTWKMLAWGIRRPQVMPALDLPLWYAQAPIALAAAAAILYALRDIARAITRILDSDREA